MANLWILTKSTIKNWLSVVPKWPAWPFADYFGLGSYVQKRSVELVTFNEGWKNETNRRERIKSIFLALVDCHINYEEAPTDTEGDWRQEIRHPYEILKRSRIGNCLDLSLLISGMCQAGHRQAILVVLHDHAFVAVCITEFLALSERQSARDRMLQLSTANAVWANFGAGIDAAGNPRPYNPVTTNPKFLTALEQATEEPESDPYFGSPDPEPSNVQSCIGSQLQALAEPSFCLIEATEATLERGQTFESAQREGLKHLRGAVKDPTQFRFALDITYHPKLGLFPYGEPGPVVPWLKIILVSILLVVLLYKVYRTYADWPEEWMPRASFPMDPIDCNVDLAKTAFLPPANSGSVEVQGQAMMPVWKFWTIPRKPWPDYQEYLVARPKEQFGRWYSPFAAEVEVTYDTQSKVANAPKQVDAQIKEVSVFLERSITFGKKPQVRYRQQMVEGDFAAPAFPWGATTVYLQPPDKGESLLLLLRIQARRLDDEDRRPIPIPNEINYYPLPAAKDHFHVNLQIKKWGPQ